MFKPVVIPNKKVDVRVQSCECPTVAMRQLCCIDENGKSS